MTSWTTSIIFFIAKGGRILSSTRMNDSKHDVRTSAIPTHNEMSVVDRGGRRMNRSLVSSHRPRDAKKAMAFKRVDWTFVIKASTILIASSYD